MSDHREKSSSWHKLAAWMMERGYHQDENGQWHAPAKANGDGAALDRPPRGPSPQSMVERCRRYLAKRDPSISGAGGHDAAWLAAQDITRGYGLSVEEGLPILQEFNQRCVPPWSESELRHKIEDAAQNSRLPVGYIINRDPPKPTWQQTAERERVELLAEEMGDIEFPKLSPPDRFPVEVFPPALAAYASEIGSALSCPVDLATIPMLAVAGAVLGNSRALRIKRNWHESGRFYMATVAHPGSAKSPAERIVKAPVIRLQQHRSADWKRRKEIWQHMHDQYEEAKKRGRPPEAMPGNPGPTPAEPHLFTTDATVEAMCPILQANPRGLVFMCDELTAWLMGMNQYKGGNGRDRQFFLSAWSGETVKVDRKGSVEQGSIIIPRPFLNIVGGIQPGKVRVLCENGGAADGFLDRILFSYPVVEQGARWSDATVSVRAEEVWERVIGYLYTREMVDDADHGFRPFFVDFTPDARLVWVKWYNTHQEEMTARDFPEQLVGIWSKLRAYAARFALVMHYLRLGCQEVTGEVDDPTEELTQDVSARSMFAAAGIIDYFKSHLRRVYDAMETTPDDALVNRTVAWLLRRDHHRCLVRDMIPAKIVKKASAGRALVKEMADRGLVNVIWRDEQKRVIAGMCLKANQPASHGPSVAS